MAAYFNGLPRWRWRAPLLAFSDVACAYVTPEVVKMPPSYRFDLGEEGPPLSVKIGYGEDGDLKIANHHVSSRVPLI